MDKPALKIVADADKSTFDLDRFKSKRPPGAAGVVKLVTGLPIIKINEANDFVRVHSDETTWTPELCFVSVPVKGQRKGTSSHQLHLIDEEIALTYLPPGRILRFRLALASKPYNEFFLVKVPTQNLDNSWNQSNLAAIEIAKRVWVWVASDDATERYRTTQALDSDAFNEPDWLLLGRTCTEAVGATFKGLTIENDQDDALKRLIGKRIGP